MTSHSTRNYRLLRSPSSLPAYALTAAIAVVLGGCGLRADDQTMPPPPQVGVAEVQVRDVAGWDEFTGRVSAIQTVQLRPRVGGYIERVLYNEGQEVAAGDVLFQIDARSYRANFDHAQAEVARARSRAELADSELERALKLAQSHAISNEVLEQRQAALAQTRADVRAAEAQLTSARLELDFTQVRAPISGRAGRALVTAGNLASPDNTVLTTLVSLDPVHVYFEADEQAFLRYRQSARGLGDDDAHQGNPVRVGLSDETGFPHQGVLDFIDNQVDAGTGTIRARAVLDNGERRFTPGLFARVQLLDNVTRPVLLIDDKAVLTDQDRKYVYVVAEDGSAQRRDVELGRRIDSLRIIESGLIAGDRVIVNGVQKVFFPGMPVDAQPADVAAGAALADLIHEQGGLAATGR